MKILTNHLIWTVCCLFLSVSLFSSNITILESQSIHPLHKMDANWNTLATNLGHSSSIVGQNFLDNYANLANTDVLIISSGLIDIPENRRNNVLEFVRTGGNVYIQSEYLLDLSGNVTFQLIVDNLGGDFEWTNEVTGNLSPMNIVGELGEGLGEQNSIGYYWYGTSGTGDDNFIPFLQHNNQYWGFVYCPTDINYGRVITTSDQDWIRTSNNTGLMANILNDLVNNIVIDNLPTVSITDLSSPCENTHTFTATIENDMPGITIQWYINGQIVANENGSIFTSDDLEEGDVVEAGISLTDDCADYSHVSNPVIIAPIFPAETPELTIDVDFMTSCEGQMITFNATTTPLANATNITYQWLVNGEPQTGANSLNFSSTQLNDQDMVTCQMIFDEACATDVEVFSNELQVVINPVINPDVAITASLIEICEGELITFTATGTDLGLNPVYQWQVDGNDVGTNSPVFSSTSITNGQNINCLLTNTQATCATTNEANSNTISIIVNEVVNPSIEITASSNAICSGEMVTITATASDFGTNPTYQWQIDGLNVGTNQPNYTTTNLEDGQQISCILSVVESCTNSAVVTSEIISFSVFQGSVPTLSIASTSEMVCPGATATFTASGENHGTAPTYEWFVNGASVGNNAVELVLENITANQEVSCILTNDEVCPQMNTIASNTLTLGLSNLSIDVMELSLEQCDGHDGLIEIVATGGVEPYDYDWSTGEKGALLTDLAAGNYTLVVTDANGCSESQTIEITNTTAPQITDVAIQQVDCSEADNAVELILENTNADTKIEWINTAGDVISTSSKVENLLPGIYEIAVTNGEGCEAFETVEIEEKIEMTVMVEEHLRVELGASVELESIVNIDDNVTYEWYPAEGLSCTDCPNPVANPTNTTDYTVIITTAQGCTASDEMTVQVIPTEDIYIPNAFSPNGDGVNDAFTAYGGDTVARIKTLKVFNRWGAQVFGNEDFSVNIEAEGWNGIYKGEMMDAGVYVYYMEVEFIDGRVVTKKGDLSITK